MPRNNNLRKSLKKMIVTDAREWLDEQLVRLGNYSQEVLTSVPGKLYARQYNGKVIIVHNGTAHVPARFDLHVRVGRKKSIPNVWQIIAIQDDYDTPAADGEIGYHHTQHEFPAPDTVWVQRKQIVPLTVLVSDPSNFVVQVYGDVATTPSGLIQINSQTVDLITYVVTSGAKFVTIETDDNGVLTVHQGTSFSSPLVGTVDNVPTPAAGKYMLAYILLYEGQTALSNNDIRVPMPLGFNPIGYSPDDHVHSLDDLDDVEVPSPDDGDFLRWDQYLLRWIAEGLYLDEILDVDAPAPTDGQVLTWDDYAGVWVAEDPVGGAGGHTIKEEGTPLTQRAGLNFIGAGVTATDDAVNNETEITIPSSAEEIDSASADTPVDADHFGFRQASGGLLKKITWANIKATLKTYFDTLYATVAQGVTNGNSHDHNGGDGGQISFDSLSSKPAAVTNANDIFRVDSVGASGFTGTINGTPSGTSVVYNVTSGQENSMVPQSTSQLAKQRLYNTTRGNHALISNCNTGTNTITLTATVPANWANGDTITTLSQTVSGGGFSFVDLEITSGELLGKTSVFLLLVAYDSSVAFQTLRVHPFETYSDAKLVLDATSMSTSAGNTEQGLYKLVSNVVTAAWSASGAATGLFIIRQAGYLS